MNSRLTYPPQHPFPGPQPTQPQPAPVPTPMVYVYEREQWEYKVIVRDAMSEQELNALGAAGWELAGVVAASGTTQFYFKRARSK